MSKRRSNIFIALFCMILICGCGKDDLAENVIIKSNSVEISELHANQVVIKKPFTINFLKKRVYIDEIECTTIEAENLKCKKLCAHDIKLSKKCEIDVLEYSGTLQLENGCVVKELIKL